MCRRWNENLFWLECLNNHQKNNVMPIQFEKDWLYMISYISERIQIMWEKYVKVVVIDHNIRLNSRILSKQICIVTNKQHLHVTLQQKSTTKLNPR